jgi:hypothetical protein
MVETCERCGSHQPSPYYLKDNPSVRRMLVCRDCRAAAPHEFSLTPPVRDDLKGAARLGTAGAVLVSAMFVFWGFQADSFLAFAVAAVYALVGVGLWGWARHVSAMVGLVLGGVGILMSAPIVLLGSLCAGSSDGGGTALAIFTIGGLVVVAPSLLLTLGSLLVLRRG